MRSSSDLAPNLLLLRRVPLIVLFVFSAYLHLPQSPSPTPYKKQRITKLTTASFQTTRTRPPFSQVIHHIASILPSAQGAFGRQQTPHRPRFYLTSPNHLPLRKPPNFQNQLTATYAISHNPASQSDGELVLHGRKIMMSYQIAFMTCLCGCITVASTNCEMGL